MSHRSKGKGKKPTKSGAESKGEDVLPAVILADSFQDRFRPFTLDRPRCLLPLANTPLIEYTLEFLAMNGVNEVYIYCGAFTDQVEDYINRSRWATSSHSCPFSVVQFVRVSDARSVGDVLRDLDKRSLVDGDFLVVHGDLVSNIILDGILSAHRKRREADAANMMTMVLRSGGLEEHRTKDKAATPVFAVDSKTRRLLHYDEMSPLESHHYVTLDPTIPDELSTEFELRSDLIDAHVDICTPEVLALWSESFDYELPRKHFLHGVLKDWELNGKSIHTAIVEDGYAARASNLQAYDSISRDIMGRWTFPFVPENNLLPTQAYQRCDNGLVTERNVFLAHDARLTNTVIGRDSAIGSGTRISNCSIGNGCKIGSNVVLEDSLIWDNTTIEDGSTIAHSLVGDSAIIGANSTVNLGSLIGPRVRVCAKTTLAENTVLSTLTLSGQPIRKDTQLLGSETNAGLLYDAEEDASDGRDFLRLQRSLIYSLANLSLSTSSISTFASDVDTDDESDRDVDARAASRSRLSSFTSDDSVGKMSFHADAVHGLLDALRADSDDFDSAKLEFMGLRLANDASDAMMRNAVATAFARRAAELLTPEHGSLDAAKAAKKAIASSRGATTFIDEIGIGGQEAEQSEFILALQKALEHIKAPEPAKLGTLLAAMLQQLYALDLLEEEGVLGWWQDARASEGEKLASLREKCKVLVDWLENADDDDDDDDDESSDDD